MVGCEQTEELTLDDLGLEKEDWDEMNQAQRDILLRDAAKDLLGDYLEYGISVID
ncbi:MAG: hypothetical protein WC914_06155 [Proteiniphilum sp.]